MARKTRERNVVTKYGAPLVVIARLWEMIEARIDKGVVESFEGLSGKPEKKHLLWCLHKLKEYGSEFSMCSNVGKPDPKTFRKWATAFTSELAALKDQVVSHIFSVFFC